MANEITASGSISYTKGNYSESMSVSSLGITVAGSRYQKVCQTVGTSEEVLNLGDVGAGGMCMIKNLDGTNFVSVRAATGAANLIKIPAGGFALFPMAASITPYVIADSASVDIEVLLIAP